MDSARVFFKWLLIQLLLEKLSPSASTPVWMDRVLIIDASSKGYAFWSCFVFSLVFTFLLEYIFSSPPLRLSFFPFVHFLLPRVGHKLSRLSLWFKPRFKQLHLFHFWEYCPSSDDPSGGVSVLSSAFCSAAQSFLSLLLKPVFVCCHPPYRSVAALQPSSFTPWNFWDMSGISYPLLKYSWNVLKWQFYGQLRWLNE